MRYGLRLASFALGPRRNSRANRWYSGMDLDVGEAEEPAERIRARIAALDGGVDTIVLDPLDGSLRRLELIAEHVLPKVRA